MIYNKPHYERKANLQCRFRNIQPIKGKDSSPLESLFRFFSVSNPARIARFAFFVTSIFSFGSDIDVAHLDNLKETLEFKHIFYRYLVHYNILTCVYA